MTRVNFRQPEESKLVVRMSIDRHNCFYESCAIASASMLAAVTEWRDAVADMIHQLKPEVTPDEKFARLFWARILKGNAEAATLMA